MRKAACSARGGWLVMQGSLQHGGWGGAAGVQGSGMQHGGGDVCVCV